MPECTYKAEHKSGEVWPGSLTAGSADEAAQALNKMGLFTTNIVETAPQSPPVKSKYWNGSFMDANHANALLSHFCHQTRSY